jgi:translation initiation factor 3 subunit D
MFMYLGGTIFIDVREQDKFERLTVHETSNRQPTEDGDPLNSASALADEATRVCADYSQDVLLASDVSPAGEGARIMGLKMDDIEYWNPADFPGKSHASVAYRYRKVRAVPIRVACPVSSSLVWVGFICMWSQWNFPDVSVVVRSKVNAVDIGKKKLLTTFALTEWDARYSGAPVWRSNLDARKGQVLGSEIRNNNAKFSRWMAQTLLAGADEMRVGFVSRTKPSSRVGHTLLGVQSFTPATALQMFSMNQTNMWGILKWSIDLVKAQAAARRGDTPDDEFVAKFVLVRDPSRAVVSLYSIPPNMFEPDEEEGEGDDTEA